MSTIGPCLIEHAGDNEEEKCHANAILCGALHSNQANIISFG